MSISDNADLKTAQTILNKHDSIQGSLTLAQDYAAKAQQALDNIPQSPLRALLHELVPYTIFRKA